MSKFSTQLLVFLSTLGLLIFADYGIGIMQANSSTPPSGDLAQWWASTITPTPTWDYAAEQTAYAATQTAYAPTEQAEQTVFAATEQAEQTAFAATYTALATTFALSETAYAPTRQAEQTAAALTSTAYAATEQARETAQAPTWQAQQTAFAATWQAQQTTWQAEQTAAAATGTARAAITQAAQTAYAPTRQAAQTAYAPTRQAAQTAAAATEQVDAATSTALALTKTEVAIQPTRSLPAEPQTLLVTTLENYLPGSLQWQIGVARAGDTIQITQPGTISLFGDRLTIAKDLTIIGPGSDQLAISANNQTRVLAVFPGVNATLQGMTLRDGAGVGDGGAVLNRGNLTMRDVVVRDSRNEITNVYVPTCGGGIYNDGTLTLIDSLITNNHATAQCRYMFEFGTSCEAGIGGGLCNVSAGTYTLQNSFITNNSAQSQTQPSCTQICPPVVGGQCFGRCEQVYSASLYPDIFSQDQPPVAATPTATSTAVPAPLNLTPRVWLPFLRS